jgi:hypothetical protein
MVGMGLNYAEIASRLEISVFTAKRHAEDAAAKVPGNLPAQMKLIMWVRGVSLDALEGSALSVTIAQGGDPLISHDDTMRLANMPRARTSPHGVLI